jgi:hypothetical protein
MSNSEFIIFYGNRVADIRIQDDKVNTLQARMGIPWINMGSRAALAAYIAAVRPAGPEPTIITFVFIIFPALLYNFTYYKKTKCN